MYFRNAVVLSDLFTKRANRARCSKMFFFQQFNLDKIGWLESFPSEPKVRDRGGIGRRRHRARNVFLPSIFQSPRGRI